MSNITSKIINVLFVLAIALIGAYGVKAYQAEYAPVQVVGTGITADYFGAVTFVLEGDKLVAYHGTPERVQAAGARWRLPVRGVDVMVKSNTGEASRAILKAAVVESDTSIWGGAVHFDADGVMGREILGGL